MCTFGLPPPPKKRKPVADIQTYETFSSVSILLLDLADSLDDKPRHLAMAAYQLIELGLLLVERTLDSERAIAVTQAVKRSLRNPAAENCRRLRSFAFERVRPTLAAAKS